MSGDRIKIWSITRIRAQSVARVRALSASWLPAQSMAKGSLMDPVLASTPPQLRDLAFATLLEHSWSQTSARLVPSQVVPAATERLKLLQVRGSGQECLQVRVWISNGVRKSWGRTVRGLDLAVGEASVTGTSASEIQGKGIPHDSNPFPAKLTTCSAF